MHPPLRGSPATGKVLYLNITLRLTCRTQGRKIAPCVGILPAQLRRTHCGEWTSPAGSNTLRANREEKHAGRLNVAVSNVVLSEKGAFMNFKLSTACFLTMLVFGCDYEGGTSKSMQEDFDKIRLDHILSISALVEEYKTATGRYPFETESKQLPAVVIIETEEQKETHAGKVPIILDLESRAADGVSPDQPPRIDRHTTREFEKLLSVGLKRDIVLPKDHQRVPVNKPSVYVYTYYLSVYDVTAFLHHDLPFARKLSPFNNKVTVGNKSVPDAGIWKAEDLMRQNGFQTFLFSEFNRPGYELKTVVITQPSAPSDLRSPSAPGAGGR